jgi:hypothetical protein
MYYIVQEMNKSDGFIERVPAAYAFRMLHEGNPRLFHDEYEFPHECGGHVPDLRQGVFSRCSAGMYLRTL